MGFTRAARIAVPVIYSLCWVMALPAPASAAEPRATVDTGGIGLNQRTGGSTAFAAVGRLPDGTRLDVACQVDGKRITGTQRQTAHWDRLSSGHYVSDAYVRWSPARPQLQRCGPSSQPRRTVSSQPRPTMASTGPHLNWSPGRNDGVLTVIAFTTDAGRITAIDGIRNPDKLVRVPDLG